MSTGWWSERFANFTLEVTPVVSVGGAGVGRAEMNLPVSLSMSMDGAGISLADMVLNLAPEVSFIGEIYLGTIALDLTPAFGMDAAGTSTAAMDLTVTPSIGMVGAERYTAAFGLTVTPEIGQLAYIKQLPHPIPWTL